MAEAVILTSSFPIKNVITSSFGLERSLSTILAVLFPLLASLFIFNQSKEKNDDSIPAKNADNNKRINMITNEIIN